MEICLYLYVCWILVCMIDNMFILISNLLIFVVAVSRCSVIMEENSEKNYSKYCDVMEHCGNTTHVMCMHHKSYGAMGPSCVESRKADFTRESKQHILSVINGFRIKVAKGEETGKYGEPLPKAYGMRQMHWDEELALFAQVSANYCRVQTDLCRATDAYPKPDQYSSVVRFTHPDWQLVGDDQYTSVNNLTEDKVTYVIDSVLNEMYHGKDQVTRSRVDKHYGSNIYLTMVYGWSTHIGCGMTTFVSFDQEKKFNDVVFVCNLSHQPTVGQKVYETEPPHKERVKLGWSEKCGCEPGLVEREDCLCIGNIPGCLLDWHCHATLQNITVIINVNDTTNITNPARIQITDAKNIYELDNISHNYNATATATSESIDATTALSTNTIDETFNTSNARSLELTTNASSEVLFKNTFDPATSHLTSKPTFTTSTHQKEYPATNITANLNPDIISAWPSAVTYELMFDTTNYHNINDIFKLSANSFTTESTSNTIKKLIINNNTAPVTLSSVELPAYNNIKLITDFTKKSFLNAIDDLHKNIATVQSTDTTIVEMTTKINVPTTDISGEIATNKAMNRAVNTTDQSIYNTTVEESINNVTWASAYSITNGSATDMIIATTNIVGELIAHAMKLPTNSSTVSIFNTVTNPTINDVFKEYANITNGLIKLGKNNLTDDNTTNSNDAHTISLTATNFTTSIIKPKTNGLSNLTSSTNTSTESETNYARELTIEPNLTIINFTRLYSSTTFKLAEEPTADATPTEIISNAINQTTFTLFINSADKSVNTTDETTSRVTKQTVNMIINNFTIEHVQNIFNKTLTATTKKPGMERFIYITKANENPATKINSPQFIKSKILTPLVSSWDLAPDPSMTNHQLISILNEYPITTKLLTKTSKSLLRQDPTLLQVLLSPPIDTLIRLISQPLIPPLKELIMPSPNELPHQLQRPPYIRSLTTNKVITNLIKPTETSATSLTEPCSCDSKFLVLWKALEKITKLHRSTKIIEVDYLSTTPIIRKNHITESQLNKIKNIDTTNEIEQFTKRNLKPNSKKVFENNVLPLRMPAFNVKPIKITHKPPPDQLETKSNSRLHNKPYLRNNAKKSLKPATNTEGSKKFITYVKRNAASQVDDDSVRNPSSNIIQQIFNHNNSKVSRILATNTKPLKNLKKKKSKFAQKTITTSFTKPNKSFTSKNNKHLRNNLATATTNTTGIQTIINKLNLRNNTTAINKVATNTKPRKKPVTRTKNKSSPTRTPVRKAIKRELKNNSGPMRMPATNNKLNKKRKKTQFIKTNTKSQKHLSFTSSTKLIRKPATNTKRKTIQTVTKTLRKLTLSIIKQNKKVATHIKPAKKSASKRKSTTKIPDMRKKILRRSSIDMMPIINSIPTELIPDLLKLIEIQEQCHLNDQSCVSVKLNIPLLPNLDAASREKLYGLEQSMLNLPTMVYNHIPQEESLKNNDPISTEPRNIEPSHTNILESNEAINDILRILIDENTILDVNENEGSIDNSHMNILNDIDAEKNDLTNSPAYTTNQNFALTERPNNTLGETKDTIIADLLDYENKVPQDLHDGIFLSKEIYVSYLPQEEENMLLRSSFFKSAEDTDNDYNSNSMPNSLMPNRMEDLNMEDSVQTTARSFYVLKPNVDDKETNHFNFDLGESAKNGISEKKYSASTKRKSIFLDVPRLKLPSQNNNNDYIFSKVSSAEAKNANSINVLYDTEENSVLAIRTPIVPQNQNDISSGESNRNVIVERLNAPEWPLKNQDELLEKPEFKQIESVKDDEEKVRNYNDDLFKTLPNKQTQFIDFNIYTITKSPLVYPDVSKWALNKEELLQRPDFNKTESDIEYEEKLRNYNNDVSNILRNKQTQFIDSNSHTITNTRDNIASKNNKISFIRDEIEATVVLDNGVQPNLSHEAYLPAKKESIFRMAPRFKLSAVSKQAETKDNTTTKVDNFDIVDLLDNSDMKPSTTSPNLLFTYADSALNKFESTAIPPDKSSDDRQINVEIGLDNLRDTNEINYNKNHNINTLLYAIEPKPKKTVFEYTSNNEINRNSNIQTILSFVSSSVEEDNEVKLNKLLDKIDEDIDKKYIHTVEPKIKKIYGYIFHDTS